MMAYRLGLTRPCCFHLLEQIPSSRDSLDEHQHPLLPCRPSMTARATIPSPFARWLGLLLAGLALFSGITAWWRR